MTFTIVQRWTVSNIAASTKKSKRAQAFWKRHGAQGFRLSHIFTALVDTTSPQLCSLTWPHMRRGSLGRCRS